MSSPSPVSICSNALLMLGDSPISSFEETTDRARLASNLWEPVRDHVLRSFPWNCALKRVVLAPDATTPAFDYAYQFTLPGDYLRLLSVGAEGERPPYRIEGRKILMDDSAAKVRYIFRNDVVGTWDASLVWAMTEVMRGVFAYGVTQSTSLEAQIQNILAPLLRQVRATDGQEDDTEALDDSPLVLSRYIGAGSPWGVRGG